MNHVRASLVGISALTLLVSGCSTPEDSAQPILAPQFGSSANDSGVDVAVSSTGKVYALTQQYSIEYNEDDPAESEKTQKVVLQRREPDGDTFWTRTVASVSYLAIDYEVRYDALATTTNKNGDVYTLILESFVETGSTRYRVNAYNAAGTPLRTITGAFDLANGRAIADYEDGNAGMSLDSSGNLYVASVQYTNNDENAIANVLTKYASNGTKLWERKAATDSFGPVGVAVPTNGEVYLLSSNGLSRYSSSGTLRWTKAASGEQLIASGSSLYVRKGTTTVDKHNLDGNRLWSKTQTGLIGLSLMDISGDGSGNVHLAGEYYADYEDYDAFIRKLSASGAVLYTRTYGTDEYENASSITTANGNEVYTLGDTDGGLVEPYKGQGDVYLRKTNSSGSQVWIR